MHTTNHDSQNGMNTPGADFLPECLRQYLITIDKPNDSYEYITLLRDHRIRLLLRRFTNQIQHGCRNAKCTVPTCLSYRKRNATRPVRPYIDVAAKALAAQCVEQCLSNGIFDGIFEKDKGKPSHTRAKSKNPTLKTGLCYSDPIVPWYSHPDERSRNTNGSAALGRKLQSGPATKPISDHTNPEANGSTSPRSNRYPGVDAGKLDRSCTSSPTKRPETLLAGTHDSNLLLMPQSAMHRSEEDLKSAIARQAEPAFDASQDRSSKKDHASFVQWLYDSEQFRAYENPRLHGAGTAQAQRKKGNLQSNRAQDERETSGTSLIIVDGLPNHTKSSEKAEISRPYNRSMSWRFLENMTLRVLPGSAILWLRHFALSNEQSRTISPTAIPSLRHNFNPDRSDINRFIRQCIYFTFANPQRLMRSALSWDGYSHHEPSKITAQYIENLAQDEYRSQSQSRSLAEQRDLPGRQDFERICTDLVQILRQIVSSQNCEVERIAPVLVEPLMATIGQCYRRPPFLEVRPECEMKYFSNSQTAYLVLIIFCLLYGLIRALNQDDMLLNAYSNLKSRPVLGEAFLLREHKLLTDPVFVQGFASIASLICHRVRIDAVRQLPVFHPRGYSREVDISTCIISLFYKFSAVDKSPKLYCSHIDRFFDAMKTVFVQNWDRQPFMKRTGPTVGALVMLAAMHKHRSRLLLSENEFYMPDIGQEMREIDLPSIWHSFQPDVNRTHILEYPFLFTPNQILRYFRSINLRIMKQAHEKAMTVYAHAKAELVRCLWQVNGLAEILEKTRSHMARYFVMTISRETPLEDAIGQIWRREHQELLRPLKVRIGKEEGEEGIDHGGVQQEFFRLAFAEALDPGYGMFDVDQSTYMAWFKPGSLEPLHKFEALGILLGLAVFNGVTVPITMPLAFYKKILDIEVAGKEDIEDGWPELSRSFRTMLEYNDGDVGDVIGRTYEFSYDAFGTVISINMTKSMQDEDTLESGTSILKGKKRASSSAEDVQASGRDRVSDVTEKDPADLEAPLVTNANRQAYVDDYVDHLLNITVQQQFEALLRGIHTILSPRSLSLFSHSPSSLKLVVEGHPVSQPLDLDEWSKAVTYDDYEASEPLIVWFWEILRQELDQTQLRKLLEFVTACNRIPVNGWAGVTFLIQKNGEGDARLPTSSTCYGRLLLPSYSSKEVLKEKLEKAIENSLGFGAL